MKVKIDLKIFLIIIFYFLTKNIDVLALTFIFIFVHELGHVISGITVGLKLKKININFLGFSIEFENYGKQRNLNRILIDAAGPFVNLIIFIISIFLKNTEIAYINLVIIFVNILPIYPLDGGRITKNILLCKKSYKETMRIVERISKDTLILITVIFSFLILYFKNLAFFLFVIYLWYLTLKEHRRNRLIQKVFKTIDNNT